MLKLIRGLADKPRSQAAGPFTAARAVAWSFLGIRKRAGLDSDASAITPMQAIGAGLIGAALFVFTLLSIVRFVTS